ncbi:helix-turn-helix transcriptional regulator [Taibaiella lutea]|uniref:Helix-turn-helix transcriptional regulator n=1 Tax=Taibaiella lutea TaxID=2608001 RepID=A0A5M6CWH5_9BACT|nr:helix-turn-helix transcriptional regulator [Taibaiella lutea]KAA5537255.1 helix-turn-helix transcriptional regulator [Taibaiella lutea]
MDKKIHEGRNVKRFREMMGIKQEALAYDLGEDWNQKKISLLEQKETIDTPILQQIATVLKIPVEAFQNFDEEQAINIISNTFHDGAVANAGTANFNCTFNPLDKVMELFERLLASEREKVELMKEILEKMK